MLTKPTFRTTWLPLLLAVLALVILNLGLYTRLASQPEKPLFSFPYYEDFVALSDVPYEEFGGDWDVRDGTLVQMSTSGYDLTAFIPLELAADQPYRFATTLRFLGGTMGGGLMFNAQQMTSRQKSHMARFNVDGDQLWLIYGYFADDSNFVGQGSAALAFPPTDAAAHRLSVQVNGDHYDLMLDETLIAENIALQYRGGTVGFISATSQVAFDNVVVDVPEVLAQPATAAPEGIPTQTAPEATTAVDVQPTTLFVDTFDVDAGGASLWKPISGEWRFENGTLLQQQTQGFDLSTIYQKAVPLPMTFTTIFQHRGGSGGGVLFNLPLPDSKNGGHMVRYVEDATYMTWGYFDDAGVFIGQGGATVSAPVDTLHTLEIITDEQTYAVRLDGVELSAGVALHNPSQEGFFGLTTSQSSVAFHDVAITGSTAGLAAAPAANTSTTMTINPDAATGVWIMEGSVLRQTATEAVDYIAGTGLAGERFSVSVDILLPPDNPDAGAGLVVHMAERDNPSLGSMVRFGRGGQEIFWGSYDTAGVFAGAGSTPLTLASGETHTLMLIVRDGSYDIRVDDTLLVEAIPLTRQSGWIGLVSFGGTVEFSNVRLELGA